MTVTDETFAAEVLGHPRPVLVDLWAPWCGPCRTMAPGLEKVAANLAGKLKVVKVDIDKSRAIANKHGVSSVPTLLVFHRGKVVGKKIGATNLPGLRQLVAPVAS